MSVAKDLDRLAIDTIRTLSMDAVQKANSGHPGTPMALAPVAYALFERFLRYHPEQPDFPNRDRFVLSAGHASMLLYSALHLWGFEVTLDQLKSFRQLGSACAGHPEYGHLPGVETTTGPLGQGCSNAVGMAMAAKSLGARHAPELFDHQVVALCGDGDLMEGVSCEAASLAGHLGLDNLIWIYDANRITIEGSTDLAFTEDVGARFEALGWAVSEVADANDVEAIVAALEEARARGDRPTLIVVRSHIAWGSPNKQDTCDAHGAPLGEEEIRLTKKAYGWDPDLAFHVPEGVRESLSERAASRGRELVESWNGRRSAWAERNPERAAELEVFLDGGLPEAWDLDLPRFDADPKGMAGRAAFGKALNATAKRLPWLFGGSADLGSSNKTTLADAGSFQKGAWSGRNLHFGVREHAMGAVANGLALSGFKAYTGTFFVFSDYMRPSMRLAALMGLPVSFVFTHDSIGVGEDGPTHQPVEHLASLRAMPNLDVLRPGDANEVVEAWRHAITSEGRPTALVLSRQNHPVLDRERFTAAEGLHRGGYVLAESKGGAPELILIGSGTELGLVVEAWERLDSEGLRARVVSLPCWEIFERQDAAWRDHVLPPAVKRRVAVEAAAGFGWEKWVGPQGRIIAQDGFGASAPGGVLFREFGFTADAVVAAARDLLRGS